MRILKNKYFFIVPVLLTMLAVIHSCKKNDPSATIKILLTRQWQLASLRVDNFSGDSVKHDTLNTTCGLQQILEFRDDGTCNYTNYSCINENKSYGDWTLSEDQLHLSSTITCRDNSKLGTVQPFLASDTSQVNIVNLGENSLVLEVNQTLDTLRKTPLVLKRRVTRYGFITSR